MTADILEQLSPGEKRGYIDGERIVIVGIDYSQGESNPTEDRDIGEIIPLRHSERRLARAEEARESDVDAVELSYYEHTGHVWFVRGESSGMVLPDFQWDGVDLAGVWIPSTDIREEADESGLAKGSDERKEFMRSRARDACELFTQWGNGHIYRFDVAIYPLERYGDGTPIEEPTAYENRDAIFEESETGFYGIDTVRSEAADAIAYGLKSVAKPKPPRR